MRKAKTCANPNCTCDDCTCGTDCNCGELVRTCENPLCTCENCTCVECKCGVQVA